MANCPEHFRPSRMRDQNTFEVLAPVAQKIVDAIVIPVAVDGFVFHLGLVRDGAFTQGRSNKESRHTAYDAVLIALQKLADPAWPRPTDRCTWSGVVAARWEHGSRADFDYFAGPAPLPLLRELDMVTKIHHSAPQRFTRSKSEERASVPSSARISRTAPASLHSASPSLEPWLARGFKLRMSVRGHAPSPIEPAPIMGRIRMI